MKIYPHAENGEIIELVRKDEHHAVVAERDQLRAELTTWQAMAERLATAHKEIANEAIWPDAMRLRSLDALAAYESAKKGELPNPLTEAVKRMEEVPDKAIERAYWKGGSWFTNVRALFISTAKGEQP